MVGPNDFKKTIKKKKKTGFHYVYLPGMELRDPPASAY